MDLAEIGAALRAARKKVKATQADVAKLAGLSRTTVNQLENGVIPDVGLRKVLNLCDHLGLVLDAKPKPSPRTLPQLQQEQENERQAAQQLNDRALGGGSRLKAKFLAS